MDLGRPLVAGIHLVLASILAIIAVIGIFGASGLHGSGAAGDPGVTILGGVAFGVLIVLPLSGVVSLGIADWQLGRGPGILRAADFAAFLLAAVELSVGATGVARWLAGSVALLAASGLASSVLVAAPRRPGFRR